MSRFQPIHGTSATFSPRLTARGEGGPQSPTPLAAVPPATAAAEPEPTPEQEAWLAARLEEAEARIRAEVEAEAAEKNAAAEQKLAAAEALIVELDAQRAAQAREARQLVGEVIMRTTRRLVGDMPVLRDMTLRAMLDEAAGLLLGEREVVLRVRPEQVPLARGLVSDRQGWAVREDRTITAGLRVEASRGAIDATLETALEAVEEAIDDWLEEGR